MRRRRYRRRNPIDTNLVLAALLLGGGALAVYFVAKKIGEAGSAAAEAVNPVSTQNIFYRGAGAVTGALTGEQNVSLGSKIADWFKSASEKQVDTMLSQPAVQAAILNTPDLSVSGGSLLHGLRPVGRWLVSTNEEGLIV